MRSRKGIVAGEMIWRLKWLMRYGIVKEIAEFTKKESILLWKSNNDVVTVKKTKLIICFKLGRLLPPKRTCFFSTLAAEFG